MKQKCPFFSMLPDEAGRKSLLSLLSRYPALSLSSLGKSVLGRDIPLVRVGHGRRAVLYVGAHHGMEWITSILLMKYLTEYAEAVAEKKTVYGMAADYIYASRTVYVVPMLNPDGVALQVKGADEENPLTDRLRAMSGGDFSCWQANGRGVDLNHNYDAGFADYKRLEPSLNIFGGGPTRYAGEYPESEPETAALCGFLRATEVSLLLALHTQGGEIYADYNGYYPKGALSLAERMARLSGYRIARPEKAAAYGGLKDWFIAETDRPGFTLECGKGVNPLPEQEAGAIYEGIRGILMTCPAWC